MHHYKLRVKSPHQGRQSSSALLGLQGLFLIIIGLIAFFGGFVGVYDVSHGHTTPGAIVAVLGAFLAWIFLLGGDCFLALCTGVVDVAALGILVDDCPGDQQPDCGKLRADAAAVHPVAHYFEHECRGGYPPICTDSDRSSRRFPTDNAYSESRPGSRANMIACIRLVALGFERTWLRSKSFTPLQRFSSRAPSML